MNDENTKAMMQEELEDEELDPELYDAIQTAEINSHVVTVPTCLWEGFVIELLNELKQATTGRANEITEKLLEFATYCLEEHST